MSHSRNLLLVALLALLGLEAKLRGFAVAPLFAAVWLVVGIGHGLFDALLAARLWRVSVGRATLVYAAFALLAAILGYWLPTLLVGLHAVVSAYHFGQSEWGEPLPRAHARRAGVFLWGIALVFVMVLGPWKESREVLRILLGTGAADPLAVLDQIRNFALVGSVAIGLVCAGFLASSRAASDTIDRPSRILETALLQGLFLTMPLWVAFPLYLSLWHGFAALSDDVLPALREAWAARTARRWILATSAATAVGTVGALGLALWVVPSLATVPWFAGPAAFAFLMAVTLPHATVMAFVARSKASLAPQTV